METIEGGKASQKTILTSTVKKPRSGSFLVQLAEVLVRAEFVDKIVHEVVREKLPQFGQTGTTTL